jgi:hypothetical protein
MVAISVKKVRINRRQEYLERERFSQDGVDTHMHDGGELYGVIGLGRGNPTKIEAYEVAYRRARDRYGDITQVCYTGNRRFKRLIVWISQVGVVDIVKKEGEWCDGPDWTTMALSVALENVYTHKKDLERIVGLISPVAGGLLQDAIVASVKRDKERKRSVHGFVGILPSDDL